MLGTSLGVVAWIVALRLGRRVEPDRSGRGWAPRNARGVLPAPRTVVDPPAVDRPAGPVERWLLGLAAPFVERTDLDHASWSLVPEGGPESSRRRVGEIVTASGLRERDAWRARLGAAQQQVRHAGTTAERAYGVSWAAWVLRLGVAAGHLTTYHAREELLRTVGPVVGRFGDWPTFGDAFLGEVARRATPQQVAELRAAVGALCRPGGAWDGWHWPVEAL